MVLIAKHTKVSDYDLSSVESISCGDAPLNAEIETAVNSKLQLDYVQQDCRYRNRKDFGPKPGRRIRGPQVTAGYLNLPAQTREMFLDDGWVRTGDIGRQDKEGFLFIVDRLKELIKYKGFQVAPASLEDNLLRHDAVADVGVIGIPDEEAGELPRAYVVRKPGKQVSEKNLQEFVAGLVAPHMKLRGGEEFVDEIPRSQSGKILEWKSETRQL